MDWKEIPSVTAYRRDHPILFCRKVLSSPLILSCTPGNFEAVPGCTRKACARIKDPDEKMVNVPDPGRLTGF